METECQELARTTFISYLPSFQLPIYHFTQLTVELRLEAPEALAAMVVHVGEQHATGLRPDHLLVHLAAEAPDERRLLEVAVPNLQVVRLAVVRLEDVL